MDNFVVHKDNVNLIEYDKVLTKKEFYPQKQFRLYNLWILLLLLLELPLGQPDLARLS